MKKISEIVRLLQEFQQKNGDMAFSIEATGPLTEGEKSGCIIGNYVVKLQHHKEEEHGDWCCLVMKYR